MPELSVNWGRGLSFKLGPWSLSTRDHEHFDCRWTGVRVEPWALTIGVCARHGHWSSDQPWWHEVKIDVVDMVFGPLLIERRGEDVFQKLWLDVGGVRRELRLHIIHVRHRRRRWPWVWRRFSKYALSADWGKNTSYASGTDALTAIAEFVAKYGRELPPATAIEEMHDAITP